MTRPLLTIKAPLKVLVLVRNRMPLPALFNPPVPVKGRVMLTLFVSVFTVTFPFVPPSVAGTALVKLAAATEIGVPDAAVA